MSDSTKTRQIIELLKDRHTEPQWAHFVELRDGTGGAYGRRSFDFFAFNLWPSNSYLKIAYEIKVSRGDFFRELDNPKKRESAETFANECYFAVPCGLVKVDEVPEGWGLIECIKNGLRIKKRAKQRKVESLPMRFVASIARRCTDDPPKLPSAIWTLAGKEIDEQSLQEVASEVVKKNTRLEIRKAQIETEQVMEERYKNSLELAGVIKGRFGYLITVEELNHYLDEKTTSLSKPLVSKLEWVNKEISNILNMDKRRD